jgi:recombination protein RecT
MATQAIVPAEQGYRAIQEYARSGEIMSRFVEVLGQYNAPAYVSSVLIAVSNSDKLQQCSPQSIITSAMRAATLRLSCDPATKQAHLVPFWDNKTKKNKATLIIGYKGFYDMAMRTGRYRFINTPRIYEGMTVEEDVLTGMHKITGHRTSDTVIGYMLYFQMLNGFEKSVYMTVEELTAHAERYSKTYQYEGTFWHSDFDKMCVKTLIRLGLSRWGYFDPNDALAITATETPDEDGNLPDPVQIEHKPRQQRSVQQNMKDLGFDTETKTAAQLAHEDAAQRFSQDEEVIDIDFTEDEDTAPAITPLDAAKAVAIKRAGGVVTTLGSIDKEELKPIRDYLMSLDPTPGLSTVQMGQLDAIKLILAQ